MGVRNNQSGPSDVTLSDIVREGHSYKAHSYLLLSYLLVICGTLN